MIMSQVIFWLFDKENANRWVWTWQAFRLKWSSSNVQVKVEPPLDKLIEQQETKHNILMLDDQQHWTSLGIIKFWPF
jgi:hypothetical protein